MNRGLIVAALGTAQTLAWASSFYLPAILAAPMAAEFGAAGSRVQAMFSAALLLTALLGPRVGRMIDARGGRGMLLASNLVFVLAHGLMAAAPNQWVLGLGWVVMGLGMAMGLYDSAFATLAGLYGKEARGPITGITLIAGFASTLGWPLSTLLLDEFGWRGACLGWAGLHLLIALPLNALVPAAPPPTKEAPAAPAPAAPSAVSGREARAMLVLAFLFGTVSFNSTAIGAHMPGLMMLFGAAPAAALAAGALIGPAQVGGRVVEFGVLRRFNPLLVTTIAALAHPLAVLLLMLGGAALAPAFAIVHGAGNGVLTIARGTLPLLLFGPVGYGERQGWITAPSKFVQAATPLGFGLMMEGMGGGALWVTAAFCLAAALALLSLRRPAG